MNRCIRKRESMHHASMDEVQDRATRTRWTCTERDRVHDEDTIYLFSIRMLQLCAANLKIKKMMHGRAPLVRSPLSYLAVSRGHAPRERCSSRTPPISPSHVHALLDSFPLLSPSRSLSPSPMAHTRALFRDVLCCARKMTHMSWCSCPPPPPCECE